MQHRVSLGGHAMAWLWTTLIATALVATACSWVSLTNISAQAADSNNILLDFSAKWCGPCQRMSPIVSKLERQGFPIRQVDIDDESALASQYNVRSIPCFVLIANGVEVNRITGPTDEKQLRSLMMMLPKQNIDEAIVGKSSRNKDVADLGSKSGTKNYDEKKSFLRIPPLFSKNQDLKLTSAVRTPRDEPETVRSQNPNRLTRTKDYSDESEALTACVRIRVKDGSHVHFGSGTVIDSQPGRAVILTCGHILRGLGKESVIEVDLFSSDPSKPQMKIAQIIQYDLEADVGLLSIPCQQRLPTVKLATARGLPEVEDPVFSIGCGGGDLPTIEKHVVTAINGVVGPDNLECTGIPKQGRSGGGLYLGSEQIGVCILADPKYKRGIYTGMKPVAQLLEKAKLGHLAPASLATNEVVADSGSPVRGTSPGIAIGLRGDTSPGADDSVAHILEAVARDSGGSGLLTSSASRDYEGAEIVCIVRPKTPGAMSRVVIVNQASSRFVDDLLHESNGGNRSESTASIQNASSKKMIEKRPNTNPAIPVAKRAMQKPTVPMLETNETDRPIETSLEIQRYRRNRDLSSSDHE